MKKRVCKNTRIKQKRNGSRYENLLFWTYLSEKQRKDRILRSEKIWIYRKIFLD